MPASHELVDQLKEKLAAAVVRAEKAEHDCNALLTWARQQVSKDVIDKVLAERKST